MKNANSPYKQPSNMVSRFSMVPHTSKPRSTFPIRVKNKGQITDGGLIVPFGLFECYPGDTFKINPTVFVRMTTQMVPLMDNYYLDWFAFFVPNRLVDSRWEQIMGERKPNHDSSIDFTTPKLTPPAGGWSIGSMPEAYGLKQGIANQPTGICAYFSRGYNIIWRDWFRDENLQDSPVVDTGAGPDTAADYTNLLNRGKRHDYFTSSLVSPQKGVTVTIPLAGSAPVLGISKKTQVFASSDTGYDSAQAHPTYTNSIVIDPSADDSKFFVKGTAAAGGYPAIFADLSAATGADLSALRNTFAIQHLLEADARGGTRYVEQNLAHFGVVSPDARLQRPEFLGGDSVPFVQNSVPQTTYQGTPTRLDAKGTLAANSVFVSHGRAITYSCVEHGYIHLLMAIRADITYQQGIDRHFFRNSRYDYYYPEFAHLSEQAVISREIYFDGTGSSTATPPTGDFSVFGYQERFAELRYFPSHITGRLRSDASSTLDYYHAAQNFGSRPTLSDTFIKDTPPVARIVQINPTTTAPAFLYDAMLMGSVTRVMPAWGIPGLLRL